MIKIKNWEMDVPKYIDDVFCLDNFSAFSVVIDGVEYKTAEHAFQTLKFIETDKVVYEMVKNSQSPYDARELAHKNKPKRDPDWSDKKYKIMESVLTEKVLQNNYVKERLLATNDAEIIEDCGADDDKDWGCGIDGTGQNNLGKIWMKIREKIKQSEHCKEKKD
jgi:hypothetical protein